MFKNLFKKAMGQTPEAVNIRTRFAPSPTGSLHIGGARTALYAYLFARQHGGSFLLRIEDTDKERSEQKWTDEIISELAWLGIGWDEGPDIDGAFGPYKQSQRGDIYKKYLEQLLQEKKSYYCFCLPDDLEAKRQDQISRGLAPKYDGTCRNLPEKTVQENLAAGRRAVIRFHIENKKIKFHDLVRSDVEFDMGLLGDIVIAKNMDTPLFHFTVVVDDFLMQITHVIRGEDHLANTPRQIMLQKALGFTTPIYAHLPLFLSPNKGKMSKREGDVALKEYHDKGYLPEAIINFIALLGWNPGTEKDIFTLQELIKEFSLEKVQKAGAVFNLQKLDYLNGYYIRSKSIGTLTKLCLPYLAQFNTAQYTQHQLEKIVEAYKNRLKKLSEIAEFADFFFAEKLQIDRGLLAWKNMDDNKLKASLEKSKEVISTATKFDKESLEKLLTTAAEAHNPQSRGDLLWPLRVALSGKKASASPFEIIEILGQGKTLQRLDNAINSLR